MSVRHLIITPGVYTRCFLRHLSRTRNQYRRVHKLSSPTLVNGSFNGQPNDGASYTVRRRIQMIAGAIISLGALGIYAKKKGLLLSSVQAAVPVNRSSNRDKFNFFADIVEQSAPAVVYIEIVEKGSNPIGEPQSVSNGSGFIIDPDGLILTNAHVVIDKPHTSVLVKLHDGRKFVGKVEDCDDSCDLATVRIDCKDLPTLKLGTSKDLRAGEWVAALGSPLAFNNTVTAGIVSAVHRPSRDIGAQGNNNYIQTDAAITFGNSGGPLINLDGEAIGINSMKVATGISFAIPIDYVREFMEKCRQKSARRKVKSKLPRRYVGITMISLTERFLTELRQRSSTIPADVECGVLVCKVIHPSPAFIAGLQMGDIITHINGERVKTTSDVYAHLSGHEKTLRMYVHRGETKKLVAVDPESADEQ